MKNINLLPMPNIVVQANIVNMKPKTVFQDLILRILNGPIEDEWTIWTFTHKEVFKDVFKDVLKMSLTPTTIFSYS